MRSPYNTNATSIKNFDNVVMCGMHSEITNTSYIIIPLRTGTHWHFLSWSRYLNAYFNYNSNMKIGCRNNLSSAKHTVRTLVYIFYVVFKNFDSNF